MRRIVVAAAMLAGLAASAAAQGTIRVAVGTTLNQLDLAKTTLGDEYIYVHLVFNGLTRIDRDLTVKPDLATSWEASEDLKTWTFKLREGVKFHHGRTLDAEDVVATIKRILDPNTGSRARANLSMVEKVEAVDPLTRSLHPQHPVCRVSRHFRRAPAPHRGQRPDRHAFDQAGRHRPLQVRFVVARRPPRACKEPRLFREGAAQARRRDHAHHSGGGGASRRDRVRGGRYPLEPALRDGRQVQEPCRRYGRTRSLPPLGTASYSTTNVRRSTT